MMTEDEEEEYFKSDLYKQNQALSFGTSILKSFHREEENICSGNTSLKDTVLSFFNLEEAQQENFFEIIDYYKNNGEVPKQDRLDTMMKMLQELNEKVEMSTSQSELSEKQKVIEVSSTLMIKEFTAKYKNKADRWQRERRNRIHDPLPYHQEKKNGTVTYKVGEVDKWLERNGWS